MTAKQYETDIKERHSLYIMEDILEIIYDSEADIYTILDFVQYYIEELINRYWDLKIYQ